MFVLYLGVGILFNFDMMIKIRMIVDDLNMKFGEDVVFMYGFLFLFFE